MSLDRIADAARQGLAHALDSTDHQTAARQFILQLANDPDWAWDDVCQVEDRLDDLLHGVIWRSSRSLISPRMKSANIAGNEADAQRSTGELFPVPNSRHNICARFPDILLGRAAAMTEAQIDSAVDECTQRCKDSPVLLFRVAQYVLKLKEVDKWEPTEADEVGRRVLKATQKQSP